MIGEHTLKGFLLKRTAAMVFVSVCLKLHFADRHELPVLSVGIVLSSAI